MVQRLLAGVIAVTLLQACSSEWTGYVYPSKHDLSTSREVGTFDSLEKCRAEALGVLSGLPGGRDRGDYECGENCRGGVCKRTSR